MSKQFIERAAFPEDQGEELSNYVPEEHMFMIDSVNDSARAGPQPGLTECNNIYLREKNDSAAKIDYTWDVTDPEQWTMNRVKTWLRENDFGEQLILFFRRNHLSGKRFLKLLAPENFSKYESSLSKIKTFSYTRFQHLLKRTLEASVLSGHRKQRNNISTGFRRLSDSATGNIRKHILATDRCNGQDPLYPRHSYEVHDSRSFRSKALQKSKNTGAIYRRSFICLRNGSSNKTDFKDGRKQLPVVKINIPPRPYSTIEPFSDNSPAFNNCNTTGSLPLSFISNHVLGRSQDFGSSDSFNLGEDENKSSSLISSKADHYNVKSYSESVNSPLKTPPFHIEDKGKLWDKFKKMALSTNEQNANSRTKALSNGRNPSSQIHIVKECPSEHLKSIGYGLNSQRDGSVSNTHSQQKNVYVDIKYQPRRITETNSNYILVTRDNEKFYPIDIGSVNHAEGIRKLISAALDINKDEFSLHLTDFGCEAGEPLPSSILNNLTGSNTSTSTWKLFVNVNSNTTVIPKPFSEIEVIGARNDVKSLNEDNNLFTNIDLDDEHGNIAGKRVYSQTPSHHYGQNSTLQNPDIYHWNTKNKLTNIGVGLPLQKVRSGATADHSRATFDKLKKHTFKVIRKHTSTAIDFNKGRDSPYTRPELAPKREAPKAPLTGSQISFNASESYLFSTLNSRHHSSQYLKKVPPPPMKVNNSIAVDTKVTISTPETSTYDLDLVVPSYTPAISHVLLPQPYKGIVSSLKEKSGENPSLENHVPHCISNQNPQTKLLKHITQSMVPNIQRNSSLSLISSTSAADIFHENEISFEGAPELSDCEADGSSVSCGSDDIIWSSEEPKKFKNKATKTESSDSLKQYNDSNHQHEQIIKKKSMLTRKFTFRPTAEVVYENLEMFFPDTDLDRPILEGLTHPESHKLSNRLETSSKTSSDLETPSPSSSVCQVTPRPLIALNDNSQEDLVPVDVFKAPKRNRTIRIIAREASEARKKTLSGDIKRRNTKMWGTKLVEVTDKRMVSINRSKNPKGEYKEFAWIKGEIIGKGSFGVVYLGLNVTTGEMMAVKQVEVPKYATQNQVTVNNVDALISEVSTLRKLDHLNVVQYLGFENKKGIYSLFLEYVAGGSLGSLIRLYGHFDEQLIRFITRQVLEGLAYLHYRGILHRDIKADNLLLDNNGVCKISDFGISRKSNNIYSNAEMTMRGTVFWMAPEMVDTTQGYSAKVDIWSLGCIVLEMFAGRRPWSNLEVVAAMFQIGKSKAAPPIPEDTLPLISQDGRSFFNCCFEVDPEARPTADTLLLHPFSHVHSEFDFSKTDLAKFIKQNDKLNSSKLRPNSDD